MAANLDIYNINIVSTLHSGSETWHLQYQHRVYLSQWQRNLTSTIATLCLPYTVAANLDIYNSNIMFTLHSGSETWHLQYQRHVYFPQWQRTLTSTISTSCLPYTVAAKLDIYNINVMSTLHSGSEPWHLQYQRHVYLTQWQRNLTSTIATSCLPYTVAANLDIYNSNIMSTLHSGSEPWHLQYQHHVYLTQWQRTLTSTIATSCLPYTVAANLDIYNSNIMSTLYSGSEPWHLQ